MPTDATTNQPTVDDIMIFRELTESQRRRLSILDDRAEAFSGGFIGRAEYKYKQYRRIELSPEAALKSVEAWVRNMEDQRARRTGHQTGAT